MDLLPSVFEPAFAQRALLATIILAVAGGVIGTWIVLHDLAFFTHAAAAGAFPLVVLAPAGAVATEAFSFVGALLFAGAFFVVARRTGERDLAAGILLTTFLAIGALLQYATSGSRSAESLFFGSVLTVDGASLAMLAGTAAIGLTIAGVASSRWTAAAFDRKLSGLHAFALVLSVALIVAAALPTLGALLVAALVVVPTATARLICRSIRALVVTSVTIGLTTGVGGLWIALQFDLPPGAAIATLGLAVFTLVATAQAIAKVNPSRPALAYALLAATFIIGCGDQSAEKKTPTAVASTPIVADLARAVAGKGLNIEILLDPGADPHHYEPRPSDLAKLADARVVLRSGGDIDAWMPEANKASGSDRRPVDLSAEVVLRENDGVLNPHWFLDPTNVIAALDRIRIEFTKAAPEYRETYRANAHQVASDYRRFDRWALRCMQRVPAAKRKLIAGHNAFDYLTARYDIAVPWRLTAANEHSEPSAKTVARAVRTVETEGVRVLAVVRSEANGAAKQVASDSGARIIELHGDTLPKNSSSLLELLYEDVSQLAKKMDGVECMRGN